MRGCSRQKCAYSLIPGEGVWQVKKYKLFMLIDPEGGGVASEKDVNCPYSLIPGEGVWQKVSIFHVH